MGVAAYRGSEVALTRATAGELRLEVRVGEGHALRDEQGEAMVSFTGRQGTAIRAEAEGLSYCRAARDCATSSSRQRRRTGGHPSTMQPTLAQ